MKNDDTMGSMSSIEVKNAMNTARLGYDPMELLREAYEKYVDKAIVYLTFEEIVELTAKVGDASTLTVNPKHVGDMNEAEFRRLAEIAMLKLNAWHLQKKAARIVEKAQAKNNALFDDLLARLGVDETRGKVNAVMDAVNGSVHTYDAMGATQQLEQLLKAMLQ